MLKVWERYGQFGQFIDADTLAMDVNGSTAGCCAGAGMAVASQYFRSPKYLKVAEAATTIRSSSSITSRRRCSGGMAAA